MSLEESFVYVEPPQNVVDEKDNLHTSNSEEIATWVNLNVSEEDTDPITLTHNFKGVPTYGQFMQYIFESLHEHKVDLGDESTLLITFLDEEDDLVQVSVL